MKIRITNFAKRHFNPKNSGTKILDYSIYDIEHVINTIFKYLLRTGKDIKDPNINGIEGSGNRLIDGYADFCKLLIVENFTDARVGTTKITNENYQWLRSSYVARAEGELSVLTRTLHLPMSAEKANYLVFVLYTKEQLKKEYDEDIGNTKKYDFELEDDCEWGVVAIMGQSYKYEEPMTPATMIRNYMGIKFGGSGAEINIDEYEKSVEFWSNNALIK